MEELLSLKWNNHRSTFLHILGVLRDKQSYTDVTLACDGKFYSVHKLVLSTCSDYFCAMFEKTSCKSPVIVLKDIKCEDLEALLDYMYLGEVNVRQTDLASLIKAAENLRIKGLAVPDDEPGNKVTPVPTRNETRGRDGGPSSPPAKRKRRDEGEDGRDDVRPVASNLHIPPPHIPSSHIPTHVPPPPSRPKSPVSQRLSPSPHRTSQESPSTEDRISRPHPSPADPPAAPHVTAPSTHNTGSQDSNQFRTDDTPSFVKVEMEEESASEMPGDSYDLSADGYKEEGGGGDDSGGGMNSDLPEFLQAAASGALAGSSYPHHTFAGPSGYQPGDLAGWQGDASSLGFPAHLNFTSDSSQQNAPGEGSLGLQEGDGGAAGRHVTCTECSKVFYGAKRKYRLDRHMLMHSGLRPFKCPHCQYSASQQGNLNRHIKNVHTERQPKYYGGDGLHVPDPRELLELVDAREVHSHQSETHQSEAHRADTPTDAVGKLETMAAPAVALGKSEDVVGGSSAMVPKAGPQVDPRAGHRMLHQHHGFTVQHLYGGYVESRVEEPSLVT